MAIRSTDTDVTQTIDERIVATARCSQCAAAHGIGTRIVSTHLAVMAVSKRACEMVTPVVRCRRSRHYVIVSPSELGNYKIADTYASSPMNGHMRR
jgi:hypothetical protein